MTRRIEQVVFKDKGGMAGEGLAYRVCEHPEDAGAIRRAAEREARRFVAGPVQEAGRQIGPLTPGRESFIGYLADAVMIAAAAEGRPFVLSRPHRPRALDEDGNDLYAVGTVQDDGGIEIDRVPDLDQALRLLGASEGVAAGLKTYNESDDDKYPSMEVYERSEDDDEWTNTPPAQYYGHLFAEAAEHIGLEGWMAWQGHGSRREEGR